MWCNPMTNRVSFVVDGLVLMLLMLCEQIVNADQSFMDEINLEMIYLGKKRNPP
jgi:hypothetical protein